VAAGALDGQVMGDPEQQGFRGFHQVEIRQGVHADVGFLHQVLDVLRPGSQLAEIAMQGRPVLKDLIHKPVMTLFRHGSSSPVPPA
jgi:hypothetical protein